MVNPERVLLALKQIPATDGFVFEQFANSFLVSDFPNLRPVGGVHDEGRDAFVYQAGDDPETFVQSSVTASWASKIRGTVETLKKNGHDVHVLVYCTNQDIQKDCGELKKELRLNHKVTLDVRDVSFFVAFANASPSCIAATEGLARKYVDPLMARLEDPPIGPRGATGDEQRIAVAFLRLALDDKDSEKNLSKFSYETLVKYALRRATAEVPVPRALVHEAVGAIVTADTPQRRLALTDGAIERLVHRGIVKHHTNGDAFTLGHRERTELQEKVTRLAAQHARVEGQIADRVRSIATELGVDFVFDRDALVSDAQLVCDRVLASQAEAAARAFAREVPYAPRIHSISEHLREIADEAPPVLASMRTLQLSQAFDLLVPIVDDMIRRPSREMRERFRAMIDGYCLFFVLRETPDIQAALSRVLGDASIIVDANIIIPCMAESLLPDGEAQMTLLLHAAVATGMRLLLVDDVLEELETHIQRLRYMHANRQFDDGATTARYGPQLQEPLLYSAWKLAAKRQAAEGSFSDFLDRFAGRNFPRKDLVEYLKETFGIVHDPLTSTFDAVHKGMEELGTTSAVLKGMKKRRPWVDETTFERLVLHDTRSLLAVEVLRSGESGVHAGSGWWWLTLDRTAHRLDELRKRPGRGLCCMSPDFFSRFLSLRPTPRSEAQTRQSLPVSVEVAALDLIPKELTQQALDALKVSTNEPEYLRQRRLRDLLHDARATRGEMLSGGVADLAEAIEESLLALPSGLVATPSAP